MHWVPPTQIANIVRIRTVILPEEFRAESHYAPKTVHAKRWTSQLVEKKKEPNPATRVICPLSRQKKRWLMPVKEKKQNKSKIPDPKPVAGMKF